MVCSARAQAACYRLCTAKLSRGAALLLVAWGLAGCKDRATADPAPPPAGPPLAADAAAPQEEPRLDPAPAASNLSPTPRPSLARTVALHTKAKSYLGTPWDVEGHLASLLRDAGLSVTGDSGAAVEPDAELAVHYEETRGATYQKVEPQGTGTNVKLTVSLTEKSGKRLAEWAMRAGTPSAVDGGSLYAIAIENLTANTLFPHLGDLVAARLAAPAVSHETAVRLLPLVITEVGREDVRATLKAIQFVPGTPREEVYMALADDDTGRCAHMGEPAVDPLVEALESIQSPSSPWIAKIVPVLGQLGSPRAEAALVAKLPSVAYLSVVKALQTTGRSLALMRLAIITDDMPGQVDEKKSMAAAFENLGAKAATLSDGPKAVILDVHTRAWRAKPFDIEVQLQTRLSEMGAQVLPRDAPSADGILVVDYSEVKSGTKYQKVISYGSSQINWLPVGEPGDATDVDFTAGYIDLHKKKVFPLGRFTSTPGDFPKEDLRVAAALNLLTSSNFATFVEHLKQHVHPSP